MARLVTEWVNVTGDISIVACESGEVWFHTRSGAKEDMDPFATPMTGAGSKGSTVGLLDGAINLGFAGIEQRLARPGPTLVCYAVALVGAYHTSVDTPRNLRHAAGRFEELGRPEVAAYLEERAREETGATGDSATVTLGVRPPGADHGRWAVAVAANLTPCGPGFRGLFGVRPGSRYPLPGGGAAGAGRFSR